MTNAFELAGSCGHRVPGSRGSFKQASIVTMEVLRESRSSLLAMLEAFLYDPLLSWTVRSCRTFSLHDAEEQKADASLSDPTYATGELSSAVQELR